MAKKSIQLTVVSQEKKLEDTAVSQVTLPTSTGEITVLPDHIPLLSQVAPGIMEYVVEGKPQEMVLSSGFVDVGPNDTLTIMVDTAVHARQASEAKAQAAIEAAKKTMAESPDKREQILAEASLRQAMLELKLAQKTKKAKI